MGLPGWHGIPKAPSREEGGDERWLITYADMITLLLVLFIILYSMANADVEKFQALAESLRDGFGATAGSTINTGAEGGSGGSPLFPDGGSSPLEMFPEGQTPVSIFTFAEILEGSGEKDAGDDTGLGAEQLGAELGDRGIGENGQQGMGAQDDRGLGDRDDRGLGDQGDAGSGDAGDRANLGDQGDQGVGDQGDRANLGDQGDAGIGDQGDRNLGDEDQGDRNRGDQGDRNLGDEGDAGVGDAGDRQHLGDQGDQGVGDRGEQNLGDQGDAGLGDTSDAGLGDRSDAGLGDTSDAGLGDDGDAGLGADGAAGLGDDGDAGIGAAGDRQHLGDQGDQGVGDQGERNIGDRGDAGLGDTSDAGLGDRSDAGLGDVSDAGLGDRGDAGLGDTSDAGLGDQGTAGLGDDGRRGIADTGDRSGEADAGSLRYQLQGIIDKGFEGEGAAGADMQDIPHGVNIEYDERGIRITAFPTELWFESGSSRLKGTGREFLDLLLPFLIRLPNRIEIQGHTDNIPINTAIYPSNWELSAGRAGAVIRYLEDMGLSPSRLQAAGYADTMPVDSNATRAGRANNRRVEILILREEAESWDEWRRRH